MKHFVFSMQKILDLRNFELDQAELDLGKVNAEIARVNRSLEQIAQERVNFSSYSDSSSEFNVWHQSQDYFIFLDQKKEGLLAELAELQLLAEKKREVVRQCMQKVKVLDKLKKHKYEEWQAAMNKQDEKIVDDVVTSQQHAKVESGKRKVES